MLNSWLPPHYSRQTSMLPIGYIEPRTALFKKYAGHAYVRLMTTVKIGHLHHHDHYEPVTAMMKSLTPTFYKDDKSDQIINID